MELFIGWLTIQITFLIGYFLGKGSISKEGFKEAKQAISKVFNTSRVGAIRQPTARDVYLKQHPEMKAGMDEMAQDLRKQGV